MNRILIILTLIVTGLALIYYGNNAIEVTEYEMINEKWPEDLNGYRIVHLSDLQSKLYGRGQKPLLDKVESLKPDLIVFTGDLIDRRHYAKEPALQLMNGCNKIAPTAFVTGNHEIWHGSSENLKAELEDIGVLVLDNKTVTITNKNASFRLSGLADRANFMSQYDYKTFTKSLSKTIKNESPDAYSILLSHRPEQMPLYGDAGFDLVFSGHSHGGQFQLPIIGGVFAPNQGLLPEYDGGLFSKYSTTMAVSRGLGNSIMPIRFFNQPEIPVIVMFNSN